MRIVDHAWKISDPLLLLPSSTSIAWLVRGSPSFMSLTLAKYENFLVKNVSTISTLESSLRSMTWFLPGRFKDADLVSEARQSYITADVSHV